MRQHFSAVQMASVFKHITNKHHNQWDHVLHGLKEGPESDGNDDERNIMLAKRAFYKWRRVAGHEPDYESQMEQGVGELFAGFSRGIAPVVEGRIRVVSSDEANGKDNQNGEKGSRRTPALIAKKAKAVVVDGLSKIRH